ncbi:MAG: GAF domain-containing protein, partial [Pseudomonadota bacterium]
MQTVLQNVVDDVVDLLGCVGALVATLENNNSLPARAYSVNLGNFSLQDLETQAGGQSLLGPQAVAYLDDEAFQDNLSVRAIKGGNGQPKVIVSDRLYDLFRPVVNELLSDQIQTLIGIKQVIAIPFFIEDEVVGNLFAASPKEFSKQDVDFLTAFAKQAAIAIQSQRHLGEVQALERIIFELQTNLTANETQILQTIVNAVVSKLGYFGALAAPLESDNKLPFRAYTTKADADNLGELSTFFRQNLVESTTIINVEKPEFQENIAVQAIRGEDGHPG